MNFRPKTFTSGKVVYYINGQRFENSKGKKDGKDKAVNYCLVNFLNPNDIQKFDSRLECDYYEYLISRMNRGEISNLYHHYLLQVQEEFINANGDTIPPLTYEADFLYFDNATKQRVVVDVKGSAYFIDERFLTLKSVFDYRFKEKGVYIQIIMRDKDKWYEWRTGDRKKSQRLIQKQREEIKLLKREKHQSEIRERQKQREMKRVKELLEKKRTSKLTKVENERLEALLAKNEVELLEGSARSGAKS